MLSAWLMTLNSAGTDAERRPVCGGNHPGGRHGTAHVLQQQPGPRLQDVLIVRRRWRISHWLGANFAADSAAAAAVMFAAAEGMKRLALRGRPPWSESIINTTYSRRAAGGRLG